eukprot:m.387893 g.387893  ORF g.387893 m.387893 type:complete len:106 (-) comp21039_c1_seq3:1609-1926(-)
MLPIMSLQQPMGQVFHPHPQQNLHLMHGHGMPPPGAGVGVHMMGGMPPTTQQYMANPQMRFMAAPGVHPQHMVMVPGQQPAMIMQQYVSSHVSYPHLRHVEWNSD